MALAKLSCFLIRLAPCIGLAIASSGAEVGLDVTMEGSTRLGGGSGSGGALHGLALAHVDFPAPTSPNPSLAYSGYLSALALVGHGPTERFLGDFLAASNIEGYPGARLYSWWVQAASEQGSLRLGALLADEEFAGTVSGGNFCNSAFGWPAFISANTVNTGPAFYAAAIGVRLERKIGAGAWRVGVYDGDSFDSAEGDPRLNRDGLHYRLGGEQGWFAIAETDYALPVAHAQLKVGAWFHTASCADVRDDDRGLPYALSGHDARLHASNHGAFAALECSLAGEPDHPGHLASFVRGGFSPRDRNAIGWAVDTGLVWTGPLPSRPADTVALGLAHAQFSPRYADHARLTDPAAATPDFERVIEASYTVTFSSTWRVQADLQSITHPGGTGGRERALVFLVRVNACY